MAYYGNFYYGGGLGDGSFYGAPKTAITAILLDINAYQSEVDNVRVYHWTLPLITGFNVNNLDFELRIDKINTFDSPDLIYVYSKVANANLVNYQDGNIVKAYEVKMPARKEDEDVTWYYSVRMVYKEAEGPWSEIRSFIQHKKFKNKFAEDRLNELPSSNVYDKEILKIDLANRTEEGNLKYWTNIFRVLNTYGEDLDQRMFELVQLGDDNILQLVRDSKAFGNFGSYVSFPKPSGMETAEYKAILIQAFEAAMKGGTYAAIKKIGFIFSGQDPSFGLIRDIPEFVIGDSSLFAP